MRGVTLIEVLVVMAIIALMTVGAFVAGGQLQRARLTSSANRLAAAMRTAYQRASSTGRRLRLVVDFERGAVWLEESTNQLLVRSDDATGGADPATELEKAALEEANRVAKQVLSARAAFAPLEGPAGQPQTLQPNIGVLAVDTLHDSKPRTEGRAYVYFFGSAAERASIQLTVGNSKDPHDIISVVLSPLNGKATLERGPVSLPRPKDDAEASEAEDDAY